MICAGLLAEYYEKIGGKVKYFGKPHKNIYELEVYDYDNPGFFIRENYYTILALTLEAASH